MLHQRFHQPAGLIIFCKDWGRKTHSCPTSESAHQAVYSLLSPVDARSSSEEPLATSAQLPLEERHVRHAGLGATAQETDEGAHSADTAAAAELFRHSEDERALSAGNMSARQVSQVSEMRSSAWFSRWTSLLAAAQWWRDTDDRCRDQFSRHAKSFVSCISVFFGLMAAVSVSKTWGRKSGSKLRPFFFDGGARANDVAVSLLSLKVLSTVSPRLSQFLLKARIQLIKNARFMEATQKCRTMLS